MKEFEISVYNLSNKEHSYEFDVKDAFFDRFENSLVEKGAVKVDLSLLKTDAMMTLRFHLLGSLRLTCDRSLEEFDYTVDTHERLIFKYGEEYRELNDDMIQIPAGTQTLDLSHHIYEYLMLAVPMKKVHPDLVDDEEDEDDDEELYLVYADEAEANTSEGDTSDEESTDPRWEMLKQLKQQKGNSKQ